MADGAVLPVPQHHEADDDDCGNGHCNGQQTHEVAPDPAEVVGSITGTGLREEIGVLKKSEGAIYKNDRVFALTIIQSIYQYKLIKAKTSEGASSVINVDINTDITIKANAIRIQDRSNCWIEHITTMASIFVTRYLKALGICDPSADIGGIIILQGASLPLIEVGIEKKSLVDEVVKSIVEGGTETDCTKHIFKEMLDQHEKNFQQVTRDGESHMTEQNFLSSPDVTLQPCHPDFPDHLFCARGSSITIEADFILTKETTEWVQGELEFTKPSLNKWKPQNQKLRTWNAKSTLPRAELQCAEMDMIIKKSLAKDIMTIPEEESSHFCRLMEYLDYPYRAAIPMQFYMESIKENAGGGVEQQGREEALLVVYENVARDTKLKCQNDGSIINSATKEIVLDQLAFGKINIIVIEVSSGHEMKLKTSFLKDFWDQGPQLVGEGVHYSSNKDSKITAGFDKEARAHFKGLTPKIHLDKAQQNNVEKKVKHFFLIKYKKLTGNGLYNCDNYKVVDFLTINGIDQTNCQVSSNQMIATPRSIKVTCGSSFNSHFGCLIVYVNDLFLTATYFNVLQRHVTACDVMREKGHNKEAIYFDLMDKLLRDKKVPKEVETVNLGKRYNNHEKRLIGAQATGTEFLAACYHEFLDIKTIHLHTPIPITTHSLIAPTSNLKWLMDHIMIVLEELSLPDNLTDPSPSNLNGKDNM
ncbi:hypothetical protein EI555_017042, partial [Monodon monoceros]